MLCDNRRASRPPSPNVLHRLDRALLHANRWAVIVMLAAMALMVFANVALRFLTDQSILWVEEASRYLMIWLTFIGGGLVLRYGGHVGIDSLQERFPALAPWIRAVIVALLLALFVFLAGVAARYVALTWVQTTPVMGIPMGAVYLALPVGFGLMALHLLVMAAPWIRHRRVLGGGEFDADMVKM